MPQEQTKAPASPEAAAATATPINAPLFYANAMSVFLAGNDATITFARPHPAIVPGLKEGQSAAITEPVAIIQMSVQTLKDLYLAIKIQVDRYEEKFGEIETIYSRQLAGKK